MLISMPCYRLNGDLWFEMRELSANVIGYHLSIRGIEFRFGYPAHAFAAIQHYRATIDALISAGF